MLLRCVMLALLLFGTRSISFAHPGMSDVQKAILYSQGYAASEEPDEPTNEEVDPKSVLDEAIDQLDGMLGDINTLKKGIIRADLGRLLVLEQEVKDTRKAIVTLPTGHFDIFRAYQDMIRTFIYSEDWFNKDFPDDVRPLLNNLEKAILVIQETRGFENPFGMVVFDILKQLHAKFNGLLDRDISREFKDKIAVLIDDLADAMGIAKQGDRPMAFDAGDKIYKQVRDLYPYFDQVASSDELFETYITIQGINEYYSEAAQHIRREVQD